MVPLDSPLEPLALADPDHVDTVPESEDLDRQPVAFLQPFGRFQPELSQVPKRRQLVTLQMAELAAGEALGMGFAEAELHGGVAVVLRAANLSDKTWPGFD
jgi:hypothetical protein